MKQLLIIKLGGSVVTLKNSTVPKARLSIIRRLAKEIKQIRSLGYQIVLVHGAGSFGHPLAKKYQLHKGMTTDQQKLGLVLTQQKMLELNHLIVSALHQQNVPASTLVPHSFVNQSAGIFSGFDHLFVQNLLRLDLVPVIYGDGVLDDKWGCSILSGDTIVSYLANQLSAQRVIFLSDVDGIFDKDPKKDSSAKLIPEVNNQNLLEVLNGLTVNNPLDVTGEMTGKILSIQKNLAGFNVFITNGLKSNQIIKLLEGSASGTRLLLH